MWHSNRYERIYSIKTTIHEFKRVSKRIETNKRCCGTSYRYKHTHTHATDPNTYFNWTERNGNAKHSHQTFFSVGNSIHLQYHINNRNVLHQKERILDCHLILRTFSNHFRNEYLHNYSDLNMMMNDGNIFRFVK